MKTFEKIINIGMLIAAIFLGLAILLNIFSPDLVEIRALNSILWEMSAKFVGSLCVIHFIMNNKSRV
jgi:hypothetical protein